MKTIIIDNGHGSNTPGKQSPDGLLREWKYTRGIALRVVSRLLRLGYDARLLTPEEEDIPLATRVRRANDITRQKGRRNTMLISIHINASASDGRWHTPAGWQVFVAPGASTISRQLATALYRRAERAGLQGNRTVMRERYWTQNLAICRDTDCPAVLTENLFQDNPAECQWLLTEEGQQTITDIHVKGIIDFLGRES